MGDRASALSGGGRNRHGPPPRPTLGFVWVELPKRWDPWDPARGEKAIHLHYMLWQRAALAQARRLHAAQCFDVVHHVGWGPVNAPPALWRLGAPFVWGPLGGGQAAPLRFGRYLGKGVVREVARAVRRHMMPFFPTLRRAVANSAVILATNRETVEVLRRAGASRVDLFLDGGVRADQFAQRHRVRRAGDRLELMWAGRLEPRKALPLALEALAHLPDVPVRLRIAGEGPLRAAYEQQAAALGTRGPRCIFSVWCRGRSSCAISSRPRTHFCSPACRTALARS